MIITCSKCGAEYPLADGRIPPQGLTIKCSRCLNPIPVVGQASPPPPPPASSRASLWVRQPGGQVFGPLDERQIIVALQQRQLSGTELFSRDQVSWDPLVEHEPFARAAAAAGGGGASARGHAPPASRIARIPDATDSGEHPLRLHLADEHAVDLPTDLELSGSELERALAAGRNPAPRSGWFGEEDEPDDGPDLPVPAGADDPDLPAPWLTGEEETASYPAVDEVDLPLPVAPEADLPAPASRRQPPSFAEEVDLLAPDEGAVDLPQPAQAAAELPRPFRARTGQVLLDEEEEAGVDLLAPLEQDSDLPAPLRFSPDEDVGAWADRAVSLEGEELGAAEVAGRFTALGEDLGTSPGDGEVPLESQEVLLPPKPGGAFRVQGRQSTAQVPVSSSIDLDAVPTGPLETLSRPEFVPRDAPHLGGGVPPHQPASRIIGEPTGLSRVLALTVLLVLGVGTGLGFSRLGFFGAALFASPPEPTVARGTPAADDAPPAAAGSGDAAGTGEGTGTGATAVATPGTGSGTAADEEPLLPPVPVVKVNGIPQTDSFLGYTRALAEMKRGALAKDAPDKERCLYALTVGLYQLRYGHEPARDKEAREALEATGGDTDETPLYLTAELALDIAAGKGEEIDERLEKLRATEAENPDFLLVNAEYLVRKKDYAPAVQLLRKGMMLRSADARLTYLLAKTQLLDGKVQEGRQRMNEVLQLDPEHPLALLAVATELRNREKLGDALRMARRVTSPRRPLGPIALQAKAHILAADLLVRQGKSDDAVKELTRALTQKPNDGELMNELAKLHYQRGQYELAMQQYEAINALDKPTLEATIGLIRCYLAQRKLSQANEAIVAARRTWPDDPQLPYYQGMVHEERGKIDRAREEYQASLKLDAKFFFPTIKLARLFLRDGKKDEALKAMLRAVKDNPKAAVLQDGLGELYITLGEFQKAKKAFEKALDLDPQLHIARFHLASVLINLGEFKQALTQLMKVQAAGNDTLELHYGLARVYQSLKKYDQAIEEYNAVLALDPNNEEYAFAAGTAYFEKKDYEKARTRFDQALTLNSKIHRAHFLTGMSYLHQNNPTQAEKRFRIAVEDFRESIEYSFWLAVALEMEGKFDEAREIYFGLERVVTRNPRRIKEIPDLYFRLGRNILLAGQPGKAAIYLTKALDRKDRRPEPWYLAGEALYQLNMYEKSQSLFREAIQRKRDYPDAHYKIAMSYLLEPQPNRLSAIEHFRNVINYDKEKQHIDAYKHLGFLYRDGGQFNEAIQMLNTYLRLSGSSAPDQREVRREIDALSSARDAAHRTVPPPPRPVAPVNDGDE